MVTYDSSEDEDFKDVAWHTGTIPENVSDVRELMETGGALYKSGDFSAAADNFMEAIQIQHGNLSFPRIHAANNLCASKIGQGLYEEALRYAEQVLEVISISIHCGEHARTRSCFSTRTIEGTTIYECIYEAIIT